MTMVYSILAAICFAVGGWLMKLSLGATRPLPTLAFLASFCIGAVLQALAMRQAEMGSVYVMVLGLEAILAVGLGALLLGESLSVAKIAAIALILAGIVLLRQHGAA